MRVTVYGTQGPLLCSQEPTSRSVINIGVFVLIWFLTRKDGQRLREFESWVLSGRLEPIREETGGACKELLA
jgi:hypothetical protein